ncbi:retrotransposon ty3-gypsy subclass [Vairimorpha apis BRL 01]|uniref:Retrotransposon ty3-gypsy subclass n=1 Tax=Vairimorpha apis BRL 01 TaxID=1037528 RepID=T0MGX7_9MICR|nr:retrotransposon ty3-gypsy subclass [Vairimorpha apis BRL 01]
MANIIEVGLLTTKNIIKTDVNLVGANGSNLEVLGKVKKLIRVGKLSVMTDFFVCKKLGTKCILGIPFLKQNRATLKFGEGKCEVRLGSEQTRRLGCHRIKTKSQNPICVPLYRLGPEKEIEASKIVDQYLKEGIIRPSQSAWRAPIVMAKKKSGEYRLCVDYRRLNDITIKDAYPMPRVDDFFDALEGAAIFSRLDAKSGYHQIDMDPQDIEKTAFGTKEGLFEFVKMPFGLVNGPATFQRTMNTILREFINKFVVVYMDDILIYSRTRGEHAQHVNKVLTRLKEVNLVLNLKKCEFFKDKVNILGHTVSAKGIQIDDSRIETIKKLPIPDTKKKLQSFLGLINYCSKFIKKLYEET